MNTNKSLNYIPIMCGGTLPTLLIIADFNATPNDPLYQAISCADRSALSFNDEDMANLTSIPSDYFPNSTEIITYGFPSNLLSPTDLVRRFADLPVCTSAYKDYMTIEGANVHQNTRMINGEEVVTNEPRATSYTVWRGTLDYLWTLDNRIQLEGILNLPEEELLKPGLPNRNFGSDHMCLIARFSIDKL